MKLAAILNFMGSLVPYFFPDKEFRPVRALAVILITFGLMFAVEHFGLDTVEQAIDLTEDVVELAEEAK